MRFCRRGSGVGCCSSDSAQDTPTARGFDHFYNLEYDQALADFEAAPSKDPQAIGPRNHIAQTLLYREMYRNGALETELVSGNNPFSAPREDEPDARGAEKSFNEAIDKAIGLANARLERNPNDTGALYGRSVAYGLRANYNFLVRKAWRDALRDATDSAQRLQPRVRARSLQLRRPAHSGRA